MPEPIKASRQSVTEYSVTSFRGGQASEAKPDQVSTEEALQILVFGDVLATTMRTPGNDRELVAGFLLAEGVIQSKDDISGIAYCGRPGDEHYGHVMDVTLQAGSDAYRNLNLQKRGTITSASCGVCGREMIDDLLAVKSPLKIKEKIDSAWIAKAPEQFKTIQKQFDLTGGLHAAMALSESGEALAGFEDIGRHNAVDKVVGSLLLASKQDQAMALVVSGRVSFEIVQKAFAAGIPVVISVSAPSSLAIDFATKAGMVLASFVRDGDFNLYSGFDWVC